MVATDRGRWWPLGSGTLRARGPHRRSPAASAVPVVLGLLGRAILWVLAVAWFVVALPFRLVFGTIALLGRLTGLAIGFGLMVAGAFFLAGPFFLLGIPLFLFGLVLTLRCLD